MIIYSEKTLDRLYHDVDDMFLEAGSSTYIIKDELYPIVSKVLDTEEGKRRFSNTVGNYVNRNNSKLLTIGPIYLIPFNYSDKQEFYNIFNINEADIKNIIKKVITIVNDKAGWRLITNNPIFVLFYCIIRYFTINKDAKQLNNALVITALSFYPSVFSNYFKYEPNKGVMQYTIDNLSERFIIKKTNHIFGTLTYSIQGSWKFHEKGFIDGSDGECIRFIQRIRNDQNSLIKKIAQNYYENHKKGLSVYTTVDQYEDSIVVDDENNTTKIENITNKIVTQVLVNGVDLKLCDFASNAANVSKIELRNYLTKIVIDKKSDEMKNFIESILFLYIYDNHKKREDINSKDFVGFSLSIFKKTNSKNANINNIKNTLDKWGNDSGIYGKFNRVATRIDYTKAIFLYFILAIQTYN